MADPSRIYAQGDQWAPSAAQFNFWTEGARRAMQGGPLPGVSGDVPQALTIQVVNASTYVARPNLEPNDLINYRFATDALIAGLGDPLPDEYRLRFAPEFKAIPAGGTTSLGARSQFGVMLDALRPNEYGRAIICGPATVKIKRTLVAGIPDSYELCLPANDGDPILESSESGYWPILDEQPVADPTEPHWAIILMMPYNPPPECATIYDLRMMENPSSGWGKVDLTYNAVTETIQLDYDFTRADVLTALNAHSEFVAASVEATSAFDTGVLNGGNVCVRLPDGASLVKHSDSLVPQLSGRTPYFAVWVSGPCV